MKRRTQGMGALTEKRPGRWEFRYDGGPDPLTGKRRRRSVTIEAKSRKEAEREAERIRQEVKAAPEFGSRATVAQLFEEFMRFQEMRLRAVRTIDGYQLIIDQRIVPALGKIPVGELTPHHIDRFYAGLTRKDGSAPLAPGTINHIHKILSSALNQAVKWGWIDRSPAARATPPSAPRPEMVVPSADDVRRLISYCQSKSPMLGAFVFLAAVTGCRRGELAALRWDDVEDGAILIRGAVYDTGKRRGIKLPKNGRPRRVHVDPAVMEWLWKWRRACETEAESFGVELVPDAFIFSSWPDGSKFVRVKGISAKVSMATVELGLEGIHLHSLRHFAATELLGAGINARDAADMLGHSDPSLTLRVYAHATSDRQRAAASALSAVVAPPAN